MEKRINNKYLDAAINELAVAPAAQNAAPEGPNGDLDAVATLGRWCQKYGSELEKYASTRNVQHARRVLRDLEEALERAKQEVDVAASQAGLPIPVK